MYKIYVGNFTQLGWDPYITKYNISNGHVGSKNIRTKLRERKEEELGENKINLLLGSNVSFKILDLSQVMKGLRIFYGNSQRSIGFIIIIIIIYETTFWLQKKKKRNWHEDLCLEIVMSKDLRLSK